MDNFFVNWDKRFSWIVKHTFNQTYDILHAKSFKNFVTKLKEINGLTNSLKSMIWNQPVKQV